MIRKSFVYLLANLNKKGAGPSCGPGTEGWNNKRNIKKFLFMVFCLLYILTDKMVVRAEEALQTFSQEDVTYDIASHKPGLIEATGTHFELKDSNYLNITLNSTEPIRIKLLSVPQMITLHIESDAGADSAEITFRGFTPQTTYHKYEDNYHNHVAFTSDDNGDYTYIQDLSEPHTIFIQPKPSTKFIKDNATGGDCSTIGIWDSSTKTCTLTKDLNETIQIDSDGITVDGNGHTSTGSQTGSGIYFRYKKI